MLKIIWIKFNKPQTPTQTHKKEQQQQEKYNMYLVIYEKDSWGGAFLPLSRGKKS